MHRALRRIPGLVERSYGEVALRSREIASLIHESLERAGERLRAAPREGDDESDRTREDKEAALFRWMERYGIELSVRETDGSLMVDLGAETYHIDEVHRLVRQGRDMWTQAGRAVEDYRTATLRFKRDAGGGSNYLPEPNPEVSVGKVWQYLP